ncbi:hypothetical protein [Phytohabitans kaempferiae]|uniref:Uncharacterized protein n=1 Tax=Phytohabitans kaempferiae TaxID=1620943 RepID=A0ABV6MBN4_9ACTN
MPIVTATQVRISHITYCIPPRVAQRVTNPASAVFDDQIRPDHRLLARPDSKRERLVQVRDGSPLRCAGGPLWMIDLDRMRRRGLERARHRLAQRRDGVRTQQWRRWETELLELGEDAYLEYWQLRHAAVDALCELRSADRRPPLCPLNNSPHARLAYVRQANRRLAELPGGTLLLAARV